MEREKQNEITNSSVDKFGSITDPNFHEYIKFVDGIYQDNQEEGHVSYIDTLQDIYRYFNTNSANKYSQFHRMTSLLREVRSARMLDIKIRGAGATRTNMIDQNNLFFAASYIYVRKKIFPVKRIGLGLEEILDKTEELWGDHPMGDYISDLRFESYEEISRMENERKEIEERRNSVVKGREESNSAITLDKPTAMVLEQIDFDRLQNLFYATKNYMNKPFRQSTKYIDWHDSPVPIQAGKVIDYIMKVNSGDFDNKTQKFRMTPNQLDEGLRLVGMYLKKYPDIPNLKVLYQLIHNAVNKGKVVEE